jgi:hypothetical protein
MSAKILAGYFTEKKVIDENNLLNTKGRGLWWY